MLEEKLSATLLMCVHIASLGYFFVCIAYGYVRSVMSDVVLKRLQLVICSFGPAFAVHLAIYRSVHAHTYFRKPTSGAENAKAALCKWQFSLNHIASMRCVGCAVAHNSTLQFLLPHKLCNFWGHQPQCALFKRARSDHYLALVPSAHISIIWPFLHKLIFSAPPPAASRRCRSPQIKTLRLNKKPIDYSSFRRANNENDSNMRHLYSHQQMFGHIGQHESIHPLYASECCMSADTSEKNRRQPQTKTSAEREQENRIKPC